MNYLLTATCGVAYTIVFFVFGPIAIVIPIFFLSREGNGSSAQFTQKWAVGWVLTTIIFASVCYLFIRENGLYDAFLREVLGWRVIDTMASRGLMLDEAKSRYPITMEFFSYMLLLAAVLLFGPKPGSFVNKINSHLRTQFKVYGANRRGVLWLAIATFFVLMFIFYIGSPRASRQLMASVLYPAFSILFLLTGAVVIYSSRERE